MEDVAGDDRVRDGASGGENNSYANQERDLAPAAPELRGVEEAEESAGDDYSRADSETSREDRIEVAAEDCFFDERSEQDAHQHQEEGAARVLKIFLDGEFCFGLERGRRELNQQGETETAENQAEIDDAARDGAGLGLTPADSSPEWRLKSHVDLSGEIGEQSNRENGLIDD